MKTKGVFITGTGTEVGKTVFSALLAKTLEHLGSDTGVMKPVATGCRKKGTHRICRDAQILSRAAGSKDPMELINPAAFLAPLSPYAAAIKEHREVDMDKVLDAFRKLGTRHETLVVEGVGGVLVPLKANYFVADLIADTGLPCVVVAGARLGTINHTLLTLDFLRRRKIPVLAVALVRSTSGGSKEARGNARLIEKLVKLPVLEIPHFPGGRIPPAGKLPSRIPGLKNLCLKILRRKRRGKG